VLIAVLARAMVDTAAEQWRAGEPAPVFRSELLRGMSWRAARHGLSGDLLDPRSRKLVPALDLIGGLVEWLEPALTAYGDLRLVQAGVERLRANGNGADQQRTSFQVHGDLEEVVADAVRRTLV
jgi:carboxylate-amine ligase